MAKFVYNSYIDFSNMIMSKDVVRKVGSGGDGTCYLKKDGNCYKVFDGISTSNFTETITQDDCKLDYILLPEDVYYCEGYIVGTKVRYVDNDILLDFEEDSIGYYYKKMLEALPRFINDIKKLSELKIYMYDLCFNLMFDGKDFYAIDTVCYYKKEDNTVEEVYNLNIDILKYALEHELNMTFPNDEEKVNEIISLVDSYMLDLSEKKPSL